MLSTLLKSFVSFLLQVGLSYLKGRIDMSNKVKLETTEKALESSEQARKIEDEVHSSTDSSLYDSVYKRTDK